jgi:ferredoxin
MTYKARVDTDRCQSYGRCVRAVPEAYELSQSGKATVITPSTAPDDRILKGARNCPYLAIFVEDLETGQQIYPRTRQR